jgi:hypothetical protein
VYLSNVRLYRTIRAISDAGYLAIPNQHVASSLNGFGPAFYGAWFFTLSIGAGLSVFAVCCAWIWDRIFGRHSAFLVPLGLLWLATLVAVNSQGLCPILTSYFFFTPLVVFLAALKWMPKEKEKKVWPTRLSSILPIVLLTIIWAAHADKFLFLDIRDYLLLSNPVGKKVDDFYYRYTLYPAQVFKSLDQKTLKTCQVDGIKDRAVIGRIEDILIHYDYLPVAQRMPIDLEIAASANRLSLKHHGKTVLQTSYEAFFSQQEKTLNDFSAETDRHGPFRQATILCLLLGFPITLYVIVFALIHFLLAFLVGPRRSFLGTGVCCFLIGLMLLAPLHVGRSKVTDAMGMAKALGSPHWQQRVTGLRRVVDEGIEIGDFPVYHQMTTSPHIPERYWVAKALGKSRDPATYEDLVMLLGDPHPNVVSMAFYGLGLRGDERAVGTILKRIVASDHWYNQWYAYRALRDLGWEQTPFPWSEGHGGVVYEHSQDTP